MLATIGGWILVLAPILVGAIFGFDAHRGVPEKKLELSLAFGTVLFVIGALLYAPTALFSWKMAGMEYLFLVLLFGFIALFLCSIAWNLLFMVLGKHWSPRREPAR